MKNYEKVEEELKDFYKSWLAEYVAKTIEVEHRYDDSSIESYNNIYESCKDSFYLTQEEEKELYDRVDSILLKKYNLVVVNEAFNEDNIHLVELEKECNEVC